jgi:hypothetical protein
MDEKEAREVLHKLVGELSWEDGRWLLWKKLFKIEVAAYPDKSPSSIADAVNALMVVYDQGMAAARERRRPLIEKIVALELEWGWTQ